MFHVFLLQVMTNGDVMSSNLFEDDVSKGFFCDVLNHIANLSLASASEAAYDSNFYASSRDAFHATREDVASTSESGVSMTMSGVGGMDDVTSLVVEARPSPMELTRTRDTVDMLTKFLQVTTNVIVLI